MFLWSQESKKNFFKTKCEECLHDIKIRKFYYLKDTVKRIKREVMNQGKISAVHIRVNTQNVWRSPTNLTEKTNNTVENQAQDMSLFHWSINAEESYSHPLLVRAMQVKTQWGNILTLTTLGKIMSSKNASAREDLWEPGWREWIRISTL